MRPADRPPSAIAVALIVLLALTLGRDMPAMRARTSHSPGLRVGEDLSPIAAPAPVRTLDR
jgi:hypothetical protein